MGRIDYVQRFICAVVIGATVYLIAGQAAAQQPDDAEAKKLFEDGKEAFRSANYLEALAAFRRSYELSGRGELHYNIGLAADRLRRDEEALEAFQAYLREVEEPSREEEVRERIHALENTIAEREALADKASRKRSTGVIVGSSVLTGVGVAGITVMAVGLARSGKCVEFSGAICVKEERKNIGLTAFYGAVGFGALLGAGLWFGLSGRTVDDRAPSTWLRVHPRGIELSGRF